MPTVAYLSNCFPSPVEPYVADEIRELRRQWVHVIPCSALRPASTQQACEQQAWRSETVYLQPLRPGLTIRAAWYGIRHFRQFADLADRMIVKGTESPFRRLRCLMHTWLGIYYALLLMEHGVDHIHVHHGYFSAWIAMVAARVLGIGYSMTLHGSDLLLNHSYLDIKLKYCRFCMTVSEFNRDYILEHYPAVEPDKIWVQRMGVDPPAMRNAGEQEDTPKYPLLLSVGRLHPVKDHAFLIRACKRLKDSGRRTLCLIAGEGPERKRLQRLIRHLGLEEDVGLLGHVPHEQMAAHYAMADLVVLSSRSEGVPLVLMEAMAMGKIVLAPRITGIPELVIHGRTGFLYEAGSLDDFVRNVHMIRELRSGLEPIRRGAQKHVRERFNRDSNLQAFAERFLTAIGARGERRVHEDSVLQQI